MLTAVKALGALLLPPGILVLLALAGLLLRRRRPGTGAALLWTAVLVLLVLSLPPAGRALLAGLETRSPPLAPESALAARAQAIVVLGGGRQWHAPEYAGDTVNRYTLERLRYAARLHRASGLPVLVSGGSTLGEAVPEAELMRRVLAQDFGVPVRWVETRSRNTFENALYTTAVLEGAGIRVVLLVTHAWHMPRARWSSTRAGLVTVPAPTGFSTGSASRLELLPTAQGLAMSRLALHERLGLLWYRLRHAPRAATGAA